MTSTEQFSKGLSAAEVLAWHVAMGVDIALDVLPHDRFAESEAPAESAPAAAPPPRIAPRLAAPAVLLRPQAEAARHFVDAQNLDALREALERFEGCALKATATRLVFSDGTPGSRLMLVGEAPGGEEDRAGTPFVGRAGQLLTRMLAAIGLERSQVYIANVVPWRPPGNQTPTPVHIAACLPFIRRQIELAAPDVLVCLGNVAAQALLDSRDGISKVRGRWHDYAAGDRRIRALPMFHPSYLLRSPASKRYAWMDLLALRQALDDDGCNPL